MVCSCALAGTKACENCPNRFTKSYQNDGVYYKVDLPEVHEELVTPMLDRLKKDWEIPSFMRKSM